MNATNEVGDVVGDDLANDADRDDRRGMHEQLHLPLGLPCQQQTLRPQRICRTVVLIVCYRSRFYVAIRK